ncbi:MAG: bifunctional glutamate N-acetyltransferase/amino-acid acetyltransferase ArgJ [Devosiaceae bacterium]|nr:bifunctional glutamate N-acetyltransferase/amino-acid acetyltransferase ArgJ [Devosiaceae bacterium]
MKPSPFTPINFPDVPEVAGVQFATGEGGIKYEGRDDVLLIEFCSNTVAAGVFTKSKCPSAAVEWCREHLGNSARVLLVNSGNANAFTGMKGKQAVRLSAQISADIIDCDIAEVFLASTGVIGEALDANKFIPVLKDCKKRLKPTNLLDAAKAIMTTDTYPKANFEKVNIDGVEIIIAGIAKGSGMIAPDMATMLSFIFTDMPIAKSILQNLLEQYVGDSFNAISVDSDTSTSDSLMIFATGKAQEKGTLPIVDMNDKRLALFGAAFENVMFNLALQVVRDGEGISKLMKITVSGAVSKQSAKKIAFSIGNSPLVKTAIAGEDANWGRIVMAIGKAGEPANRDRISIDFGEHRVAIDGERASDYCEETLSKYMKNPEIFINVNVGVGEELATIYASDLTHDYISINADYRS